MSPDPLAAPAPVQSQPAPAASVPSQPTTRRFGDHAAAREAVFNNALDAVKGIGPVENTRYRMDISDVGYGKRPQYTIRDHADAMIDGRSLTHRLLGTVSLTDKATGTVVDTRRMTVAAVPYLTRQGVFVLDGSPLAVSTQLRLDPGVYTRKTQAGGVHAHVNFLPGGGVPHRVHLDPETGVFRVSVGQAELPAATMLHVLGATDEDLKKAWGDELAAVNLKATKDHHLDKYYEKFGPPGPAPTDPEEKKRVIAARLSAYRFDPWITKRTLGHPHDTYNKSAALAVTKKLLDVARGRAEPDDRDHPAYSSVWAPEHLIAERLARSRPILSKLLWQATNSGTLKPLSPGFLSPSVRALFTKSGLAQCFDDETKVLTARGFVAWSDVRDDDAYACRNDDGTVSFLPGRLRVYDYDGEMLGCRTQRFSYLVTPEHRVFTTARRKRKLSHDDLGFASAASIEGKQRWFLAELGPRRLQTAPGSFIINKSVNYSININQPTVSVDSETWASFLGWYVAEGYVQDIKRQYKYAKKTSRRSWAAPRTERHTLLCQSYTANPYKVSIIRSILDKMPFKWCYLQTTKVFKCTNRRVAESVIDCGRGENNKRIPRYVFSWDDGHLRLFFNAFMAGDGNEYLRTGAADPDLKTEVSSEGLAYDIAELSSMIGYTARIRRVGGREKKSRHSDKIYKCKPTWVVTFSRLTWSCVNSNSTNKRLSQPISYFRRNYRGKVYCATVPGGLLYVMRDGKPHWSGNSPEGSNAAEFMDHGSRITKIGEGGIGRSAESVPMSARSVSVGQMPFIDLVRTSESESVGVDLRTAFGTKVGSDRRIYAPLLNNNGRIVYRTPRDLADAVVAFPGWRANNDTMIPVVKRGKMGYAARDEVDYFVPSMEQTFSPMTNMVPMKSASKPHRSSMGGRMITQSLPLLNAQAPLVRSGVPGQPGKSFEELFGRHMGAAFARPDQGGVVTHLTPDEMRVRYDDGSEETHELYDAVSSGRKTGYQSYPFVQPGDRFGPGQILSKSNYTDDHGHAAYGTNARIAFMPFRGHVYEDSIVVSKSLADRMTSHHLYRHQVTPDDNTTTGKTIHTAAFPGKHTLEVLKNVDDDGVVRHGTVVNYGDPLVLGVRKKEGGYARLSRSGRAGVSDASETWDHDEPGKVVGVRRTPNGPVVLVETYKQTKDGDKLSGRHGNKGVIKIIADHEMPVSADGKPVEAIISSLGTISRVNPSAIFEASLGKIAAKTGNPYVVHDFEDGQNMGKFVEDELAKHGTKFMEHLTDPVTGRTIPNVGVGNLYLMKLSHVAENKAKGRGLGGYDETGQPTRGQNGGALRASLGDTMALMSYGALNTLKDAHMNRGQANDAFWSAYMAGFPVPHATTSAAFDRFLTELRAAGVNPVRENNRYRFMGLTAKDVDEMSGSRAIKNGETLDASRDNKPYPGGLLDENTFGAIDSKSQWAHIPLHEPVLNPIYEEPARRVLGLTEKQFRDTISGNHKLSGDRTGMAGIVDALRGFDVKGQYQKAQEESRGTKKTARDAANKKLGFLKYMATSGKTPADWIWDKVPVMPPVYRPVTPGRNGSPAVVSDINLLYRDTIEANEALKSLSTKVDDVGAERLNLYDAVKAVVGTGDPVTAKNKERGVKGILGKLLGDTSKSSYVQQKLLGTPVDLSGRGQVLPSPDLDLDELGLPEAVAWDVYHPFIVRRLVRGGVPRIEAAKMAADRTDRAKRALLDEMDVRPVLATRYPVLHRYGVMGFRGKLVGGSAILSNNLINKPYNLDHDGNCVDFDTELNLEFDEVCSYDSPQWFKLAEETVMRLTGESLIEMIRIGGGAATVRMPIGEFPKIGEGIPDKNGALTYAVPDGVRVLTAVPGRGAFYTDVTLFTVEDDCSTVRVSTEGGHTVTVSDNESLAVFDPATARLVKTRPADAKGKWVPTIKKAPIVGTRYGSEFGWWYGALISDGWVSDRYVGYSKVSQVHRDRFVEYARKYITANFTVHTYTEKAASRTDKHADSVKVHCFGDLVRTVPTCYAPERAAALSDERGALYKTINEDILTTGSEECLLGVLAGMLEGDGTLAWNGATGKKRAVIRINTSSKYLVAATRRLLRLLGVRSSTTETPPRVGSNTHTAYVLNPSVIDMHDVITRLPFVTDRAKDFAAEFSAMPRPNDRFDVVPVVPEVVDLYKKVLLAAHEMTMYTSVNNAARAGYATRALMRRTMARVYELGGVVDHPSAAEFRAMIDDDGVTWDKVTTVEDAGRRRVFDLGVPDGKVFAVNDGLIVYDTFTVSLPLSDDAVKETYEKLLPSKNLFSPASFNGLNFMPNMEYVGGLHAATYNDDNNPPVEFNTLADAKKAFKMGQIDYSTRVRIRNG